ncbi:type-F conjugative transfer system pilin assembly thiol-disulfide isomerase TrbB [Vibrio mediterranei]|uniref:Type-F conjugative transfer system pilin assembly thiol-disulfide isomerase TrbB n=1 Tax=Vibrio mediterranei TaxID=689 RepID=A0ABX5D7E0_9VIBR|nr:type-F conjugative transfer system pilin assembly thiol-disulfide isomerase TrbB [Vibrio mediterranei]PRQ65400.1 type-F conjugative transfer system pilin assembly thiol-disulfide isomerase TrbB [Vibrio mediterranei]
MPFQKTANKTLALLLIVLFNMWTQAASAALNDQYAMVFFFRSDCTYCHRFAPKLKQFTQHQALTTYAFTLDGGSLPEYLVPIPATPDISQLFFDNPRNITVPATFLINVNTRKYVRISVGDVSYAQLNQSVQGVFSDPTTLQSMQ